MPRPRPKTEPTDKRFYKGQSEFLHDLFKLELASLTVNKAWNPRAPRLSTIEHCHHFHTRNSEGKEMTKSNRTNGHYHEVTWGENDDGTLWAECGPAMTEKIVDGRKVPTPIEHQHTHECTYKFSEKLTSRKVNPDAQRSIALQANKPALGQTSDLSINR